MTSSNKDTRLDGVEGKAPRCDTCSGYGVVGNPPDDYWACPDCTETPRREALRRMVALDEEFGLYDDERIIPAPPPSVSEEKES